MKKAISQSKPMIVELDKGIVVKTSIPSLYHPALRAGFARYTSNPRWCASRLRAWRTGRSWRDALENGTLVVRKEDLMLVPNDENITSQEDQKVFAKSSLFRVLKRQTHQIGDGPQIQQA